LKATTKPDFQLLTLKVVYGKLIPKMKMVKSASVKSI